MTSTTRSHSRQRECIHWTHAVVHSALHSGLWDTQASAPSRYAVSLAVDGYEDIYPCIGGLLFWRRPPTVVRCVASTVVNAVKRCACGLWSHVGIERLERYPLFAHSDTAPAPCGKSRMLWIQAALAHGSPSRVLGCVSISTRGTVRWVPMSAAATVLVAGQQRISADGRSAATIAQAQPINAAPLATFGSWFYRNEESEPSSCDVLRAGSSYSGGSHAVSFVDGVVRGLRSLVTSGGLAFNYPTQLTAAEAG